MLNRIHASLIFLNAKTCRLISRLSPTDASAHPLTWCWSDAASPPAANRGRAAEGPGSVSGLPRQPSQITFQETETGRFPLSRQPALQHTPEAKRHEAEGWERHGPWGTASVREQSPSVRPRWQNHTELFFVSLSCLKDQFTKGNCRIHLKVQIR